MFKVSRIILSTIVIISLLNSIILANMTEKEDALFFDESIKQTNKLIISLNLLIICYEVVGEGDIPLVLAGDWSS